MKPSFGLIEETGANCQCLCDLSDERLDQMWRFIEPAQSVKPRFEKDHRKVFDAQKNRFDNAAANKLFKASYRKGYELPRV